METAAKVVIGAALAVGAVAGVAYLSTRRPGRFSVPDPLPKVTAPKPLSEARGRDGKTVRVYSKKSLPIRQRLAIIQDMIHKGISSEDLPYLRKLALKITSGCPARDDECEAKAIYNWVRKNIRYTGDIAEYKHGSKGKTEAVDLFQSAKTTAENGGGDCDDHTTLVATLNILNGIQTRMRVSSPYLWGRDNFSHVYPVVGLPKNDPRRWVVTDTTIPGDRFGVEASYVKSLDVMA